MLIITFSYVVFAEHDREAVSKCCCKPELQEMVELEGYSGRNSIKFDHCCVPQRLALYRTSGPVYIFFHNPFFTIPERKAGSLVTGFWRRE
jgi:hypothetical protein